MRFINFVILAFVVLISSSELQAQFTANRSNTKSIEPSSNIGQAEIYVTKGFFFGIDYKKSLYKHAELNCAEKDAENMQIFFSENELYSLHSHTLLTGEEVTSNNIGDELYTFIKDLKEGLYKDLNRVIIYFSGHGKYDEVTDEYYFILNSTPQFSNTSSISEHDLNNYISRICELREDIEVFLVVDACYSGHLLKLNNIDELVLMLSSAKDQLSIEGFKNENSGFYTAFLIKGSQEGTDIETNGKGYISVNHLSDYTRSEMKKATIEAKINPQTPQITYSNALFSKKDSISKSNDIVRLSDSVSVSPVSYRHKGFSGFDNKETVRDTALSLLNKIQYFRNRFVDDPFMIPDVQELNEVRKNIKTVMSSDISTIHKKNLKADSFFLAGLDKVVTFTKNVNSFSDNNNYKLLVNATDDFQKSNALFPSNLGACILEIQFLFLTGSKETAFRKLKELTENRPNYPNVYFLKILLDYIDSGGKFIDKKTSEDLTNCLENYLKPPLSENIDIVDLLSFSQLRVLNLANSNSSNTNKNFTSYSLDSFSPAVLYDIFPGYTISRFSAKVCMYIWFGEKKKDFSSNLTSGIFDKESDHDPKIYKQMTSLDRRKEESTVSEVLDLSKLNIEQFNFTKHNLNYNNDSTEVNSPDAHIFYITKEGSLFIFFTSQHNNLEEKNSDYLDRLYKLLNFYIEMGEFKKTKDLLLSIL